MFGKSKQSSYGYLTRGGTGAAPRSVRASYSAEDLSFAGRLKNWVKLSLTGASGILAAVVMDLQNRGDSSALFVIARSLVGGAALLGLASLPLYVVVLILMALGAGIVLYFRPRGLRPAFMTGFGSLAAVMTLVPGYSGEKIGVPVDERPANLPNTDMPVIEEGDVDQAAMADGPALVMASFVPAIQQTEAALVDSQLALDGIYDMRVRLRFPDGLPSPVSLQIQQGALKARLFNPSTQKAYNLFLSATGPIKREGDTLLVPISIPSDAQQTTMLLRIEADGYEIKVAEEQMERGANPVWDIEMAPTDEPLLWQRLKHSYAF